MKVMRRGYSMRLVQREMQLKALRVLVLALLVIFGFSAVPVNAASTVQEVTIYGLKSTYLEKVTIPAEAPQSYQINVGNGQTVTYKVTSGQSVKVSDTGCITPAYTYWKRGSGYSYSVSEGEEYDYYTLKSGDSTVNATTGGVTYTFNVHVVDYSTIYCDQVMDAYIAANITEDMSDLELVKAICRFPAAYDYSASYSSARDMVINGGGDCWASTDAIMLLSEKLDIKAWRRNGNRDPGAGSGHMNAMIELNGKYYELEAGYAMSKGDDGYRPYNVKTRTTLFSYTRSSAGITIYQYDGYNQEGALVIPETIDGYTVIGLGEKALSGCEFTSITLPDTIVSIGDFAFSSCINLTSIRIPESVSSIGTAIFASCTALNEITVATENENYKAVDNVIYSKDGSVLVTCPVASQVTILDTVTEIAEYAFYYNNNLTKITIPSSVTTLGEAAFGNCSKLASIDIEGNSLTTIGNHCFRSNSVLTVLKIPESVTSVGAYAFAYCSKLDHIYFKGNAPAFGTDVDGTHYDNVFVSCTANAYYPEGNATWTSDVTTNHGGTITWATWTVSEAVSIEDASVTLEKTEYTYNKTTYTPAVTVTLNGVTLTENTDYAVQYSNNYNAGNATVTVVGIGNYEGEVTTTFTINKAELNATAYARSYKIVENRTTEITYVSGEGGQTYSSSDEGIVKVNDQGVITGVSAGQATITVNIPESANYKAATATITMQVTHDPNGEIEDSTVIDGTIQVHCPQCNETYTATVPTKITVYWGKPGAGSYSTAIAKQQTVGTKLECVVVPSGNADLNEMEILSDHTDIAVVENNCYVQFMNAGTVTITVRPKYNPSVARSFTFTVIDDSSSGDNEATEGDTNESTDNNTEDKKDEATDNNTGDNKDEATDNNAGDNKNEATDNKEDSNNNESTEQVKYYNSESGIYASISSDGAKTATVTAMDESKAKGVVQIPDSILVDGVAYPIVTIGENAFKNNTKITSVKMGSKVKTIEANAFAGCSKLRSVTIGKNVAVIGGKAFYKCKKLNKIVLGTKVTTIKTSAFEGCTSLKSVTVKSEKLKTIGKNAFKSCKKLQSMNLKTTKLTKKSVGKDAFKGTHKKLTIKVPKKYVKKYKSYFKNKGNKKVKVKMG